MDLHSSQLPVPALAFSRDKLSGPGLQLPVFRWRSSEVNEEIFETAFLFSGLRKDFL
jgi:hypothetical protein